MDEEAKKSYKLFCDREKRRGNHKEREQVAREKWREFVEKERQDVISDQ